MLGSDVRLVHPIVWVCEAGHFRLFDGGKVQVFANGLWRDTWGGEGRVALEYLLRAVRPSE